MKRTEHRMEPEPTEKLDRWLADIGPATGLTTLSDLIQHPAVRGARGRADPPGLTRDR
ncbi:MAG: hypothetical protein ACHBNF_10405 [Chromatiales bacterium]